MSSCLVKALDALYIYIYIPSVSADWREAVWGSHDSHNPSYSSGAKDNCPFPNQEGHIKLAFWGSSGGRRDHLFSVMASLNLADPRRMANIHEERTSGTETLSSHLPPSLSGLHKVPTPCPHEPGTR